MVNQESRPRTRRTIEIPPSITVKQLSEFLEISPVETIKQLMRMGVMANINQTVDFSIASALAAGQGLKAQEKAAEAPEKVRRVGGVGGKAQPRPPVVTIMGHVDHGKTTLLDAIRQSNIAATEAGEITQHIGAYQVEVDGKKITFLDTPGHQAFTAMRARGAQVTDIAVLVVAADDGVMPQTIEAINHAKAAGVPLVVAINKMDKAEANPERVKRQLSEQGLVLEEWGGEVIAVPVSARQKQGIPQLLEYLLLVADLAQLQADPTSTATGVVIEAGLDKTRGPMATLLLQNGTLEVGGVIVVGATWGRIKAMFNDRGKRVRRAEPATPVAVLGLNAVPQPGDIFTGGIASEREARALAEQQAQGTRQAPRPITLDAISAQISDGRVKELNIVLKTDVQGSIEPIKTSLERLSTERVRLRVLHAGTGTITESDVMLALASKGVVLGFNTRPEPGAKRLAETEGVDIRLFNIIYTMIEAVEKALLGMVEPVYEEVVEGMGEVIAVFAAGGGLKRVAGVRVTQGKFSLGARVRLKREGQVVVDSKIKSLRRFKDSVPEVGAGLEAGVGVESFRDFQPGDIMECYHQERVA